MLLHPSIILMTFGLWREIFLKAHMVRKVEILRGRGIFDFGTGGYLRFIFQRRRGLWFTLSIRKLVDINTLNAHKTSIIPSDLCTS